MGFLAILCSVRVQREKTFRETAWSPRVISVKSLEETSPTFRIKKENMNPKGEKNRMQPHGANEPGTEPF
jgi:hypothetical protein